MEVLIKLFDAETTNQMVFENIDKDDFENVRVIMRNKVSGKEMKLICEIEEIRRALRKLATK